VPAIFITLEPVGVFRRLACYTFTVSTLVVASEMPASLNSLPFDLMHVVASSLDIRDYVHLSRVSKRCHNLLLNESIAWKTLQVCCSNYRPPLTSDTDSKP
jgi:F-box domain